MTMTQVVRGILAGSFTANDGDDTRALCAYGRR